MTNLKCTNCGGTDTFIRTAGELNKQFNTDKFTKLSSGQLSPAQVLKLILALLGLGVAVFSFLKAREEKKVEEAKNNPNILVCRSCNHWETLRRP